MATLNGFLQSIDMDDSIFVEDESLTNITSGEIVFHEAAGSGPMWDFQGSGIHWVEDSMGNPTVVDQGTIVSTEYSIGGNAIFEGFDMSASATTVWNAFQLGDNAALFGTLLIANDRVTGSTQNDTLGGYHGNDTVNGGTGADRVSGGAGADNLNGGDGDDVMNGGDAGDRMTGGIGLDRLTGGAGDDLLKGEADDDKVLGSAGMD